MINDRIYKFNLISDYLYLYKSRFSGFKRILSI